MERLTEHYSYPWHKEERDGYHAIGYGAIEQRPFFQIIKRLCEYEDTGLAPAEVAELAKAKADGRLVVLPCKVGDTVWLVSCDCLNRPSWITENNFEYGMLPHIGKTIFLTREEAEAAMKGE